MGDGRTPSDRLRDLRQRPRERAGHHGQVTAFESVLAKSRRKLAVGEVGLGEHQQAAGFEIDAMNHLDGTDARPARQ